MNDLELERKFLRRAMDAEEVLETAIAWEGGLADQTSIERHVKAIIASTSILPRVLETARKTAGGSDEATGPQLKMEPRPDRQPERRGNQTHNCKNCGNQFGRNHLQRCPARGQSCRNCGKWSHYTRLGRSTQQQQAQAPWGGGQHDRPKKMRYIEQDDAVDDPLEAETQVSAITNADRREEGEIVEHEQSNSHVLDIQMKEK